MGYFLFHCLHGNKSSDILIRRYDFKNIYRAGGVKSGGGVGGGATGGGGEGDGHVGGGGEGAGNAGGGHEGGGGGGAGAGANDSPLSAAAGAAVVAAGRLARGVGVAIIDRSGDVHGLSAVDAMPASQ